MVAYAVGVFQHILCALPTPTHHHFTGAAFTVLTSVLDADIKPLLHSLTSTPASKLSLVCSNSPVPYNYAYLPLLYLLYNTCTCSNLFNLSATCAVRATVLGPVCVCSRTCVYYIMYPTKCCICKKKTVFCKIFCSKVTA